MGLVSPFKQLGWEHERRQNVSNLKTEYKAIFPQSPKIYKLVPAKKFLSSPSLLPNTCWLASRNNTPSQPRREREKCMLWIYLLGKVLSLSSHIISFEVSCQGARWGDSCMAGVRPTSTLYSHTHMQTEEYQEMFLRTSELFYSYSWCQRQTGGYFDGIFSHLYFGKLPLERRNAVLLTFPGSLWLCDTLLSREARTDTQHTDASLLPSLPTPLLHRGE